MSQYLQTDYERFGSVRHKLVYYAHRLHRYYIIFKNDIQYLFENSVYRVVDETNSFKDLNYRLTQVGQSLRLAYICRGDETLK